jgi:hypothetical protein
MGFNSLAMIEIPSVTLWKNTRSKENQMSEAPEYVIIGLYPTMHLIGRTAPVTFDDTEYIYARGGMNEALQAELARVTAVLQSIAYGDVPRPVGRVFRTDGANSKHDQCTHGIFMYEDCGGCVGEFAARFIAAAKETP